MFSAIFGNIFSRTEEQTDAPVQQQDQQTNSTTSSAATQTADNKSTSTQVNLGETSSSSKLNDTSNSQLDWVIVDEDNAPNDKACSANPENLVEMDEPELPSKEGQDVLIGSFFVKNELDEKKSTQADNYQKVTTDVPVKKQDSWLITPLPCLTSIAMSQQRSMSNNDKLENMRIERPDQFMTTSTVVESPFAVKSKSIRRQPSNRYKKSYAEAIQQEDVVELKSLFTETPEKMVSPVTPTKPTRNEKRKEAEKSSPASPTLSIESPKKMSRKTGKSMKTNSKSNQTKSNKENMQMKTLLMAECFPNQKQSRKTHGCYGQMLRANKNAALFSMAGNTRQRKFHNLQQPSVNVSHPVKF